MKCVILNPFSDKHNGKLYSVGEVVDFSENRIKEIQKKNKKFIKVIEKPKNKK